MTAVLYDPWSGATIHDDALPSPLVNSDANGDYIIHRENGKSTYKAYSAPSAELPEVSDADNGDVLTVVSGEWAKAAPSGGGGGVLVATDTNGTLDKTWKEIHDSEVPVFVVQIPTSTGKYWLPVLNIGYDADEGYWVICTSDNGDVDYYSDTETGYPALGAGGD